MKCPKCNSDNSDTQRFCGECATPLQPAEDAQVSFTKTLETPTEDLTTGSTFAGRYQIIEELGKGGMGKVYRALDKKLHEEVALKLIKPDISSDKKTIERFKNELRLARKVRHSNVGGMYELLDDKGTYFISMEYIHGQDLKGLIRQTGKLAISTALSIAKQICEGLSEAHKVEVVHRDLKPNNIMIDREGEVRIMDFGIARSLKEKGITGAGVMIGTPEYMSPEQVEGKETDQRSDIYSLGVILYEVVTGRVPFEGDSPFTIGMKHKGEIPKNPKEVNAQIPEDLSRVILRCMEKEKEKRYQSAGEVRYELENIEKGIPTTEREIPEKKPITSREITVTFDLKKILIPSLVVMVTVVVALIIWSPWAKKEAVTTTEEKLSIAILPFEDLSPKKDQEYFCNGLADSIIHALTNINELRVLGRNTSLFFKEKSTREIGKMLNVETVLKGSLQKTEKNLRITAQLLKVADESILWSEQFNRALDDVFIIQDVITHSVVESLTSKFLGDRRKPIIKRYTEDKEAYELYLKGRFFWEKRGKANALKAIEYFQEAIEIDPVYALAYSGLSDSYTIIGGNGLGLAEESFPQAKAMALKALEMDDHLAEAHTSLAMVLRFYEHDFAEAEKHFKKAITLNPNYVAGHYWYSDLLSDLGRHKEAIEETLRAKELDPFSGIVNTYMWWTYYHARDFGKAIEYLQNDARLFHENRENYGMIAKIYALQGRYNEAQKLIEQAYQEDSEKSLINTTHAYVLAACGRHDEARRRIDIIIEKSKHIYISPVDIALIYIGLGDFDQAFIWLEKGFALKDFRLVHLKKAPEFDSIRSKPRFNALLKKIGLEK